MLPLQPNPQICTAIEHRRMMRLGYHQKDRILEPHDHGILNGSVQLLAYQVGGSSSRPLPNWKTCAGFSKTTAITSWRTSSDVS